MAQTQNRYFRHLTLAAFLVAGCNIFNPSGSGEGGVSADALLEEGENLLRERDYEGSMNAFRKAIEKDSANSLAYYGYAKATIRFYAINASSILTEVDQEKTGNAIPFLTDGEEKLTRYLQATSKIRKTLGEMTRRDTLTRWWAYARDSGSRAATNDANRDKRIAFIRDFMDQGKQGRSGFYPEDRFPLSDRALRYENIVVDYGFIEMLYSLVHLRDLDQNDTIDSRDDLLTKLSFKSEGGFKLDSLANIAAELETDSVSRNNLNHLIQNVQSGLGSATDVLKLLSGNTQTGDSLSNQSLTNSVSGNVSGIIDSLGSSIGFYQFGDGKDNDGDGCIDEEILDGKDNDGDGVIDEDARVIKELPDNIDNDHNGVKDLADGKEGIGSGNILVFVNEPAFTKGPRYQDKSAKVAVQADSIPASGPLSAAQQSALAKAKSSIGGCWNNY